jgi:HK97 family phage prohead protease
MKTKHLNLEIKAVRVNEKADGYESVIVEGYANRYKDETGQIVKDEWNESVAPDAYDLSYYLKNPIVLFNHEHRNFIGKTLEIEMKDDGLYVQLEVFRDIYPKVYFGLKTGTLRTLSIGYEVLEEEKKEDYYLLTKIKLFEISVVPLPMNVDSQITEVDSEVKMFKCADGKCVLAYKAMEEKTEPEAEQETETANEPETEPTTEKANEPETEPEAEPTTEKANEPETEPTTEKANEPEAEPTTEKTIEEQLASLPLEDQLRIYELLEEKINEQFS